MDDRHPPPGEGQDNARDRLSDDEQTLADDEQTLAERDQNLSDRDQQASDDDQATSNLASVDGGGRVARERTTAARLETARERDKVSTLRDTTADERDMAATRRDELSARRDEIAHRHDHDAASIDAKDEVFDRHTLRVDEIRARARSSRMRAANDRERAARDRVRAARDRVRAARDREHAASDREQAGTDELTGARRRGVGLEELANEVKRARREGTGLVAAFVDVDGLKGVNDTQGHAAGDAVLRAVAQGLRGHMRSYDLLVRIGGDEFLCALPKVDAAEARKRFANLSEELNGSSGNTVSIGYSELREGDSIEALVRRADGDLLTSRRPRRALPEVQQSLTPDGTEAVVTRPPPDQEGRHE